MFTKVTSLLNWLLPDVKICIVLDPSLKVLCMKFLLDNESVGCAQILTLLPFYRARFLPLLDSADPDCVKIVVGTKMDLLTGDSREVTPEEAKRFAREINSTVDPSKFTCDPYFETSSLTGYNVNEVFEFIFQLCLPMSGDTKKKRPGSVVDLESSHTATGKKNCC